MSDGWQRIPMWRIALTGLSPGSQIMLGTGWARSDWSGDPGKVYGFTWASIPTLARDSNVTPQTAKKRMRPLYQRGFVVPLRAMTRGELYLANEGRKRCKMEPIKCQCRASKVPNIRRNECSCRVLRPIGVDGKLIRDPIDAPLDLNGLHVDIGGEPKPSDTHDQDPPGDWEQEWERESSGDWEQDPAEDWEQEWDQGPTDDQGPPGDRVGGEVEDPPGDWEQEWERESSGDWEQDPAEDWEQDPSGDQGEGPDGDPNQTE